MNKQAKFLLFSLIFSVIAVFTAAADTRTENIDLFVVLDKSLSMEEEISSVKTYVKDALIENILIPGDFLVIIQFYGKAEILMAGELTSEKGKLQIEEKLDGIQANGHFTDIGNALDELKTAIDTYHHKKNREYLLLITDGKQEAPPESKYYSPDGKFNHTFLENARTIQKKGWKIQILGIGTASEAKEIAEKLSGGYTETSEEPTVQELTEKTRDLLGVVKIDGLIKTSPITDSGRSSIHFTLESEHYKNPVSIAVDTIMFSSPDASIFNLRVGGNQTINVTPGTPAETNMPLSFPENLPPGTIHGSLTFTFTGTDVFIPAVNDVDFRVKGFIGSRIWIIPVGIVAAVFVIGGLIFLIISFTKRSKSLKPCRFRIFIDNRQIQNTPFTLAPEESLFFIPEGTSFSAVTEDTVKKIAKITFTSDKLRLSILNRERFSPKGSMPDDLRNSFIEIKLKSGVTRKIEFKVV